jgi:enoyl-CoA hydratase
MPTAHGILNEVSVAIKDRIAIVTFEAASLGRGLQSDLSRTMSDLESDSSIDVIIFTGRKRVFLTGADLREVKPLNDRGSASAFLELPHAIVRQFSNSKKILIAAINGYCLGGGLELALSCDIRLVVDEVHDLDGCSVPFLGFPEAQVGLVPALGGAFRAIEVVGMSQAKELFFTADRITAARALQIGLVNAVVRRDELIDQAEAMAGRIANNSSFALGLIKHLLHSCRQKSNLTESLAATSEAFVDCCISGDKNERIERQKAEAVVRFRNSVGSKRA